MPGTGKYGTTYDKLAKKRPAISKMFATSPQYDGSYNHEKLVKIAQEKLVPAHQEGDPLLFPMGVDLNFAGAPTYDDVTTSTKDPNHGWPATPYTPNPMSPGADPAAIGDNIAINIDPFKVGDPNLTPNDLKINFVPGVDGTIEPNKSSDQMSTPVLDSKIERLIPGKHPGSR